MIRDTSKSIRSFGRICLHAALRIAPSAVLLRAAGRQGIAGRAARVGLQDRPVRIAQGVAAGLVLSPGRSNPAYALGVNELPVQAAFAVALGPGAVLYDVGANIGFLSLVAATLVGGAGRVYAFEPAPANIAVLRANVERNALSQVTIVESAVAEAPGRMSLQLDRYAGGHVLANAGAVLNPQGQVEVDVISLDDFARQAGVRSPDLVKIDVEGAEMQVIAGMSELLRTVRPLVLFEADAASVTACEAQYQQIGSALAAFGYEIERLGDSYPQDRWEVIHGLARPPRL